MKEPTPVLIDPASLGATLYLPATRSDLASVILSNRHHDLRSVVICLEDAVAPADVPTALLTLEGFLARLSETGAEAVRPHIFVRPRDHHMLAHILSFAGIERVDGFVIPKATAQSMPDYLGVLGSDHHLLMPTLETREVFDPSEMRRLREQLIAVHERILAIRIGGNDLLQTIGARRSAVRSAYEGPLGPVIANLVTMFAPWGFALSAPVFEGFGNPELLAEEVARDIEHGLVTKTAIHPAQIAVIHAAYQVDAADLADAHLILSRESRAVFASQQAMCEPATHRAWAESIVKRAAIFGSRSALRAAPQLA
jgi:citrate lyase beta subunit